MEHQSADCIVGGEKEEEVIYCVIVHMTVWFWFWSWFLSPSPPSYEPPFLVAVLSPSSFQPSLTPIFSDTNDEREGET